LRRRAGYTPAYRVRAYPALAAIFVASSLWIVLQQIVTDPTESLIGLGLVAAGLPVYWIWTRLPGVRQEHTSQTLPS
jgi:APA family basic amino acid/polyamine antiporter